MQKGLLLVNLGTPQALTLKAVRAYLRVFLMDSRVVDVPFWMRWCLVHGVILPFRARQTLKAYEAIWTDAGSPLQIGTEQLAASLQTHLGGHVCVRVAMRYGEPSLREGLAQLRAAGCETIQVISLFPQFASATVDSVQDALQALGESLTVQSSFYQHPLFIKAWSKAMAGHGCDHVLLSYHSLPIRQIRKVCGRQACVGRECPPPQESFQHCYAAQAHATSRSIAEVLSLSSEQYTTAFQSRLGRVPWLQPETASVLKQLHARGIKRLAVASPSFMVDCLETLEELNIRLRADWMALGGEALVYVPCPDFSELLKALFYSEDASSGALTE